VTQVRHNLVWAAVLLAVPTLAAEHRGRVNFGGLPVPGATVTASRGEQRFSTVTGLQGLYTFPELAGGPWTIQIEMQCFATIRQDVTVTAGAAASEWDLKLLPLDQIKSSAAVIEPEPTPATPQSRNTKPGKAPPQPANTPAGFQRAGLNASSDSTAANDAAVSASDDLRQRAEDGFLVNGTTNNSASSPFALDAAFGNNRKGRGSMYNGNLGIIADNSALDARAFSITGQDTPKPAYDRLIGVASFGGPVRIPHVISNGPTVTINYQWTRNSTAVTQPGLVPTQAERAGQLATAIDPTTGAPFPGNVIPGDRISPQARALLALYPLPNFEGGTRYNYQIPIAGATHQDSLQSRFSQVIGRVNQISGNFAFQSTRADSSNLFGFLDNTDSLGINSNMKWRHSFTARFYGSLTLQFSRLSATTKPFFENRENVSQQAGISGNNQDPLNWGPPALVFSGGIAGLSDADASRTHNQTSGVGYDMLWSRGGHNFTFGGDYRRQQFNLLGQQNPRGVFTFTGATTGSDLAGFLLGIPDTSAIAFGNADKYFRASGYDAYFTDDWRLRPGLTMNAGVRWEYGSPITELYGRLVNLDIGHGFSAVTPVIASDPIGELTGRHYPDSLVHADKHAFEPRVAVSWRPFPASSMVVRAGYGVYYNTSVYQTIAMQMAQQSPLSKSSSVQNTMSNPLTLANGFNASPAITPTTFAVDPNFRVGYSQNWQISVQCDLPWTTILTATYLGIKGTRGAQVFLPNTYPAGVTDPCPACPTGFAYLASNGNSTREAAQIQLRRRLHTGFTATVQYVFSKSIDDSALGGRNQASPVIAQDWLNLSGERGLSPFDQRHLLTLQTQYSTGMGMHGGTLLSGWRGAAFKEWTLATQITAGTGLPLTPTYLAAVAGTGVTGSIRPDYTGAPLYAAPPGFHLNPAAYAAPDGHWGNAGRDSITGPGQFVLSASVGRTFRLSDRVSLDLRVDSANAINHVTFPAWNTNITSAQFGLPNIANPMRTVQTTLRARF
jgi:hypothetical protein